MSNLPRYLYKPDIGLESAFYFPIKSEETPSTNAPGYFTGGELKYFPDEVRILDVYPAHEYRSR